MKRKSQKIISGFLAIITALVIVVLASSYSLAGVTFVKPHDASYQVTVEKKSSILNYSPIQKKTHAPEPTTMALYGSGLLGMIISFIRRTYFLAKRMFDVVAAAIGFIVLSPVILFTALLVKLTSRGPIIYSQTRVGKDGEHFEIYKFRTMRVDAENATGPVWASKNDNRLTPIGKFLRKSRIDELPQLFNVLRGDMSLIGPRPERPIFVSRLKTEISDYEKRLAVKPGITGLAQVWHHYDEDIADVRKKIKYDLLYIKRQCLWTDMQILFRTVRVVLTGAGAK